MQGKLKLTDEFQLHQGKGLGGSALCHFNFIDQQEGGLENLINLTGQIYLHSFTPDLVYNAQKSQHSFCMQYHGQVEKQE